MPLDPKVTGVRFEANTGFSPRKSGSLGFKVIMSLYGAEPVFKVLLAAAVARIPMQL